MDVVCHNCKERLSLDKWYLPAKAKYGLDYVETLLKLIKERNISRAVYNFYYLSLFLSFVNKHNGHKIEEVYLYESKIANMTKYKEMKPEMSYEEFEKKFKEILKNE